MRLAFGIALVLFALAAGVVSLDRDPAAEEGIVETVMSLLPAPPEPHLLADETPAPPASSGGGAPTPIEIITGGETSELAEAGGGDFVQPVVPLYRYEDGSGALRMTRGIDGVPARYRHSARAVTAGNVNHVNVPKPADASFRDGSAAFDPNLSRVTLFSAPGCAACIRAKRHLAQMGIVYDLVDVHADAGAREHVRKIMGTVVVPLLKIEGTYVSGYLAREYDRLLASG